MIAMRALLLDFERPARAAAFGYGLAAAGVVVTAVALAAHWAIAREVGRLEDAAGSQAARPGGDWVLPQGIASEEDAVGGARAVAGHLSGPWSKLFRTLEAIEEPEVALLALTPDFRARRIQVRAEARNLEAMLSYYRALERSLVFAEVVLAEHEVQGGEPERPVRFTLSASWSAP